MLWKKIIFKLLLNSRLNPNLNLLNQVQEVLGSGSPICWTEPNSQGLGLAKKPKPELNWTMASLIAMHSNLPQIITVANCCGRILLKATTKCSKGQIFQIRKIKLIRCGINPASRGYPWDNCSCRKSLERCEIVFGYHTFVTKLG